MKQTKLFIAFLIVLTCGLFIFKAHAQPNVRPNCKYNANGRSLNQNYDAELLLLDSLLLNGGIPVSGSTSGTLNANDTATHQILDSALFTNNPDIVGAPLQSVFKSTLNPQYNVFYDASNDADYYAEFYLQLTKANTTLLRTIGFFLQTNTAYPASGNSTFLDTAGLSVFQDRTGASLFADPTTTKSWFYDPSGDDNYLDEIRLNTYQLVTLTKSPGGESYLQSIDSSLKVCASNLNNISNQTYSTAQNTKRPSVVAAACTTSVSFTVPAHAIVFGGVNSAGVAQTISVFGGFNSYDALMINGIAKPSDFNPNFAPLSTVATHNITPTFTGFIFYIQ